MLMKLPQHEKNILEDIPVQELYLLLCSIIAIARQCVLMSKVPAKGLTKV